MSYLFLTLLETYQHKLSGKNLAGEAAAGDFLPNHVPEGAAARGFLSTWTPRLEISLR